MSIHTSVTREFYLYNLYISGVTNKPAVYMLCYICKFKSQLNSSVLNCAVQIAPHFIVDLLHNSIVFLLMVSRFCTLHFDLCDKY